MNKLKGYVKESKEKEYDELPIEDFYKIMLLAELFIDRNQLIEWEDVKKAINEQKKTLHSPD